MIQSFLQELLMPLVMAVCYALGRALKSTRWFPDSMIPLTLFVIGAVLAPFVSGIFTIERVMIGAVSGWAAVGLNQTLKQSIK